MSKKPIVYTAGAMDWVGGGDSYWRESLDVEVPDVEFFHPHETYFDHGGDYVMGAVAEDLSMITRSDGVVGLFTETPQVGTLVEVLHAVQNGTPVLALFDTELLDPRRPSHSTEVGPDINPISFRAEAEDHWFLVNYLMGDTPGDRPDAPIDLPAWIRDWDGVDATVLRVDASDSDQVSQFVEEWIQNGFSMTADPD